MDFGLSQEIISIQEKAANILNKVYGPAEKDIVNKRHEFRSISSDVVDAIKSNAIDQKLWAVELGKWNGFRPGFVGRIAIEEIVGGTVVPGCDFGGYGDLLAWRRYSTLGSEEKVINPVLNGKKTYEYFVHESDFEKESSANLINLRSDHGKMCANGKSTCASFRSENDIIICQGLKQISGKMSACVFVLEADQYQNKIHKSDINSWFVNKEVHFCDNEIEEHQILLEGETAKKFLKMRKMLLALVVSARCCGAGHRSVKMTLKHYKENSRVYSHEAMQSLMADSVIDLHAARLMTYSQAASMNKDESDQVMTSVAKVFSMEAARSVIDKMMQVFGRKWDFECELMDVLFRIVGCYRAFDLASELNRQKIAYGIMGRDI